MKHYSFDEHMGQAADLPSNLFGKEMVGAILLLVSLILTWGFYEYLFMFVNPNSVFRVFVGLSIIAILMNECPYGALQGKEKYLLYAMFVFLPAVFILLALAFLSYPFGFIYNYLSRKLAYYRRPTTMSMLSQVEFEDDLPIFKDFLNYYGSRQDKIGWPERLAFSAELSNAMKMYLCNNYPQFDFKFNKYPDYPRHFCVSLVDPK